VARKDDLIARRREHIEALATVFKAEMGQRLIASKKLFAKAFGTRIVAADLHSHSEHTDGASTIAENAERARLVGLDMIFATDHFILKQKRQALAQKGMSWGIEGGNWTSHIGLLHATRPAPSIEQGVSLADSVARLRTNAPFVWVTHPSGFGPVSKAWHKKFMDLLIDVDDLAMEILNGFDSLTRSYERTGRWNVKLMDDLLIAGRTVTAIGSSDVHYLVEIGNSWTGVVGATKSPASIIKGLQAGNCFASEAPLLDLSVNGKPMGSTLRPRKGTSLKLRVRAADSLGVALVRVISEGKVIKEFDAKRQDTFEGTLTRKATGKPTAYRVEVIAIDNRWAFSTPVYIR
jgi:hypothetical protein